MIPVAIYARFSSADRQNARSCLDQIAVCREHAARRGWTVVATYQDDGISGFAMANRPGILAAIAAAARGEFAILLSEDEDRLARNLGHLATIKSDVEYAGGQLATLTTDRVELMHVAFKGAGAEQYLIDLGRKTARGMRANAERGLATGSRKYGYITQPGGAISIEPDEAATIVRIFKLYADDGCTAREIADALNRDRTPTLRGRGWNASTIIGQPDRATGVLRSEIYAGVKVWNRDEVRKDPRTGARRHHFKPAGEWKRTPVEALRIVPQDLWERAQARLAAAARVNLSAHGNAKKPGLFSGLLKCAACGSTFGAHGRGRLVCQGYRQKGASFCRVSRMVKRDDVERSALEGLKTRLLGPSAVRAYVRAYHAAWTRLDAEKRARRSPLEKRVAELDRGIERLVDLVVAGDAPAAVADRLRQMEADRAEILRELAAQPAPAAPDAIALHPAAADAYAREVEALQARLSEISADPAQAQADRKAIDRVRQLVERIDVVEDPNADSGFRLRLHGNLNLLLASDAQADAFAGVGGPMVPGGGFEPPTRGFSIRCSTN